MGDSLDGIVAFCSTAREKMTGTGATGKGAQVTSVRTAVRFLFRHFGFFRAGMADWLTLNDLMRLGSIFGLSEQVLEESKGQCWQALTVLMGANVKTQRTRMMEERKSGKWGGCLAEGRTSVDSPLFGSPELLETFRSSPEAQVLLKCALPQVSIKCAPTPAPAPTPTPTPTPTPAPAPVMTEAPAPVIEEEIVVAQAAVTPPETHGMEGEEVAQPAPRHDSMDNVEEAIRLLHSYMADAGVDRILLTEGKAEIQHTVRVSGSFRIEDV
jgi:hypothetical protein